MLPKLSGCYPKKGSADCKLAEANTIQTSELGEIVEHESRGYPRVCLVVECPHHADPPPAGREQLQSS
jgi:hypothetical protein